jgi:hypothetical protein
MNNIDINRSRLERLFPNRVKSKTYDLSEALSAVIEQSMLGHELADFEWVMIDCSCFDDVKALRQMPNLKRLELSNCKKEQFEIVHGINQLEMLDVQGSLPPGVFLDIALPNLKILRLNNCYIPDLKGAKKLNNLEELILDNSVDNDGVLADIEGIKSLRLVSLYDCQITTIRPLRECKELRHLDLSRTRFGEVSMLANHPQLEWLSLNDCPVTEIGSISYLNELKELDLSGTRPSDLLSLSDHQSLQKINLSYCELPDLTPLAKSTKQLNLVVDWKGLSIWQRRKLSKAPNIRIIQLHQGSP